MNKKCVLCGWRSDKCKNHDNIHYDQFRHGEDRCSGNIKAKKAEVKDHELLGK